MSIYKKLEEDIRKYLHASVYHVESVTGDLVVIINATDKDHVNTIDDQLLSILEDDNDYDDITFEYKSYSDSDMAGTIFTFTEKSDEHVEIREPECVWGV